jgi:hypothetical protein
LILSQEHGRRPFFGVCLRKRHIGIGRGFASFWLQFLPKIQKITRAALILQAALYSAGQLVEDYINLCRDPHSDPQAWAALQRNQKPTKGGRRAPKGSTSDYGIDKLVNAYLKLCHNPMHDLQGWNDHSKAGRAPGGLLPSPARLDDGRKGIGAIDGLRQARGESRSTRSFRAIAAYVTAPLGKASSASSFGLSANSITRRVLDDPTTAGRTQAAFEAIWQRWQGAMEHAL